MKCTHSIAPRPPGQRRDNWSALAFAVSLTVAGGCADSAHETSAAVSRAECERLQERVLALRVNPAGIAADVVDRHRQQIAAATANAAIDTCLRDLTPAQVHCAIQASTTSALDSCLPPATATAPTAPELADEVTP